MCRQNLQATDNERQHTEQFAAQYPEQWRGCVTCKISHHETSFCHHCGYCFFNGTIDNTDVGTFVLCKCGEVSMWD